MSSADRYSRFMAAPLSDEARQRLRINAKLRRHVRDPGSVRGAQPALFSRLTRVLDGPPNPADRVLWDWLYCYASADVLRRLLRDGKGPLLPDIDVRLPDPATLDRLLPLERFTPDVQVYARPGGDRALVCFTGNGQKLNVALQTFHLLACGWFDRVIYLRDKQRQCFTMGIPGFAADFDGVAERVGRLLEGSTQVAMLAASAGGYAAMRYAQKVRAQRVALFSPPMTFKGRSSIDERVQLDLDRLRIYFADASPVDKKFRAPWKKTVYRHCFHMIGTDTHATLTELLIRGGLDDLFSWLSQTGRPSVVSRAA